MVLVSTTEAARRLNEQCGFWCIRVRWPSETAGMYLTAELSRNNGVVPGTKIPSCAWELWLVTEHDDEQHWIQLRCGAARGHAGEHSDPAWRIGFGLDRTWVRMIMSISGGYKSGGDWLEWPNPGQLLEAPAGYAAELDRAGVARLCLVADRRPVYTRPCARRQRSGV